MLDLGLLENWDPTLLLDAARPDFGGENRPVLWLRQVSSPFCRLLSKSSVPASESPVVALAELSSFS